MKKSIIGLLAFLISLSATLVSCDDTVVEDNTYSNWQARNEAFLDSVRTQAIQNPTTWDIYRNYKLDLEKATTTTFTRYDSVYVKIISTDASQTVKPLYTDTVAVHYRGSLCNGVVFDQSYTGDLDLSTAKASKFALAALIVGWKTALQHMTVGTRAEIFIPYQMAYGTSATTSIPAYSVLKFDIYLEKVIHPASVK